MHLEDLDSLCRETCIGGLGFIIALLVRWHTNCSCVHTGGPFMCNSDVLPPCIAHEPGGECYT